MPHGIAKGVLAVVVLAVLGGAVHAWIGPLDLVAPGLPSPTDVVKLIDTLTKKDSNTTVDVKFDKTVSQGKLLVARTRVNVSMERTSRNWRGPVIVQLKIPSDISFSVDLSEIRPEHIRLDASKRELIVAMPKPRVEDVTPVLADVKTENTYRRARFKFLDKDTSRDLQNTMLTGDYLDRARQQGEKQLPDVRKQGRGVLEAFLQRLLQGSLAGVKVVVE
jgi:hypothetical protein